MKAERNFEIGFYEDSVFHCHQALEKLFKGVKMLLLRRRPEKTHNLKRLYRPLQKHIKIPNFLIDFLSELTPYFKITRYPDIAMGVPAHLISENFARKCLLYTRRIFECFQKVISKE